MPTPTPTELPQPPQLSNVDFSFSGVELHSVRHLGEERLLVVLTFEDMNPREVYTVMVGDQVYSCNILYDVFSQLSCRGLAPVLDQPVELIVLAGFEALQSPFTSNLVYFTQFVPQEMIND